MPGFEQLDVWKRAVRLSVAVYRGTTDVRDFGFRDQITRAELSVPSNIAEGMERSTIPDQIKFLEYVRSSCGEFRTQAIVGSQAGILASAEADAWCDESREISAMIQGLIKSLRNRKPPQR